MQSVNADLVFLQMPDSAAVGFQLIFRKPDYSFVKFTKDCGFVIGQCSCDRYRVGYMVAEQVDFDVQLVDERPHLHQSFDFRLFDICAVQHFLIKLGFREYGQRHDVDDARVEPVQHIGCGRRARLAVAFASESVELEDIVAYSGLVKL